MIQLHNTDCFSILPDLEDGSVDLVFADLPYGCIHVSWDEGAAIDLESYWRHCKRLLRPGGAVVMTASLKFAVPVINAAPRGWYSYDLVWDRVRTTGFLDANRMPLKKHELILIFAPKRTKYNPQMTVGKPYTTTNHTSKIYNNYTSVTTINTGTRYPTSILSIPTPTKRFHPTEKPLALMEWVLNTYSNPGDTVLDPTMGAGGSMVACAKLGRSGVGVERDEGYFAIATQRVAEIESQVVGQRLV